MSDVENDLNNILLNVDIIKNHDRFTIQQQKDAFNFFKTNIEKIEQKKLFLGEIVGGGYIGYGYALALEKGVGCTKNKELAMTYYEKAAFVGNADAMYNYAIGLEEGYFGNKNQEEAMKYYKQAADEGHLDAIYNYAYVLENDYPEKKEEAMKYYKQAADEGHKEAICNYGCGLELGYLHNKKKLKRAMKYYKKASDLGDPTATYNYAHGLELGYLGNKKDLVGAIKYYKKASDLGDTTAKKRLDKNPLRILDSKEDCDKELLKNAPKINEFYTDEERTFYTNVLKSIGELGIKYYDNPGLVRGLDYYTSIVFEFTTTDLGAQSAVGGGGRYDNLVEQIGNIPISAVGFGSGIERLMLLLDKKMEKKDELIAVIPISENENSYTLKLVKELQAKGKSIEYIYSGKFKKKMDKMNKCGADFAIVVGEDEVKTGKLKIKDLKSGEEKDFVL
ncbi:MAG: hypothetical protein Ta2D_11460 [Rickettsiales bacterium]|nr:MAG: hypothetical protein Ta2D_11460 [Rickettsiales bacterium]